MRNLTDNLIEFTSLLDSEKIDEKGVDAILEKINAKKLVAVLASHKFFRKIFIKKWIIIVKMNKNATNPKFNEARMVEYAIKPTIFDAIDIMCENNCCVPASSPKIALKAF